MSQDREQTVKFNCMSTIKLYTHTCSCKHTQMCTFDSKYTIKSEFIFKIALSEYFIILYVFS
jgi:hypothetical protein